MTRIRWSGPVIKELVAKDISFLSSTFMNAYVLVSQVWFRRDKFLKLISIEMIQ